MHHNHKTDIFTYVEIVFLVIIIFEHIYNLTTEDHSRCCSHYGEEWGIDGGFFTDHVELSFISEDW